MNERDLVLRAKRGVQDAFEQLVLDNQNRIYALALRLMGDREEAADLAQEAFLKAWQGLPTFQGESSFSTWLYRLTSNVCIDALRRNRRRQAVAETVSLDDDDSWIEPADWEGDPQRLLERAELSRAVERGLEALPDHFRQVLVLRELSGLSYQEIGAATGLDLGTVKSRIARARLALRKILLADGNFSHKTSSNPAEKEEREVTRHGAV